MKNKGKIEGDLPLNSPITYIQTLPIKQSGQRLSDSEAQQLYVLLVRMAHESDEENANTQHHGVINASAAHKVDSLPVTD